MKRIFLVLAVAALMAVMLVAMAVPAFAENTRASDCCQQPDPGGGPPYASGNLDNSPENGGAAVFHCGSDWIGGDSGNIVYNPTFHPLVNNCG